MESFTYTEAHDLSAPIRFLTGYAKALLEDHAAELRQEALEFVNRIGKAAGRMAQLEILQILHAGQRVRPLVLRSERLPQARQRRLRCRAA